MNILPFAIGLFMASYMQNPKFKAQIDNAIKKAINSGVDALNNVGSVPNVPHDESVEPENEGRNI
jgi:hypothetical protein